MESQCLGLAEAMNLQPTVKRVRLRGLWRGLSPYLMLGASLAISKKGGPIAPPWPDMVIATGRQSILPALHIKKMSGGKSFLVQIQNPALYHDQFDVIIVPEHDGLKGENVIAPLGAMHRVVPEKLVNEAAKWAPKFAHLPRPYVAVLLGGSNGTYRLDPAVMMELGPRLAALSKSQQVSLLVTPSRRTGEVNRVLLSNLLHDCNAFVWDEKGDNPYYGMLGLADSIIVTNDSINMISEACSTGKPVYMASLPGHSEKFASFHHAMRQTNRIRPLGETLERWEYEPLNEMQRVAHAVLGRFNRSAEKNKG